MYTITDRNNNELFNNINIKEVMEACLTLINEKPENNWMFMALRSADGSEPKHTVPFLTKFLSKKIIAGLFINKEVLLFYNTDRGNPFYRITRVIGP